MKNFKNILYPSLLTLAMGGAIGCTNLDDAVLDRLTNASSISPDLTLKSAYQSLGTFTDQAAIYALTEHPSDEMQGQLVVLTGMIMVVGETFTRTHGQTKVTMYWQLGIT
jgi:hypothetical protein